MVNKHVRSEHNEIQHACRIQNKFNLNSLIYGCVNDIISNSNHTMSSSHHKSLEVFTEVWMRTPILLKCDVASPITQWHSITDQKNKSSVPVIMTAFCVHLNIPIHWGSPGFMLNRYVFPAKKGTLSCQGLEWPRQTLRVLNLGMQVSKYIHSLFNDNQ